MTGEEMRLSVIKMLKRFWLTILTFVITFSFQIWLLSPRPYEILHFQDKANVYPEKCMLSPDNRYLLCSNGELHLIDLHSRQNLLTIPHTNEQFGFDAQGRFVWIALQKLEFMWDEWVLVSLWRYEPLTGRKTKLTERLIRSINWSGGTNSFNGMQQLGLFHQFALLSHNCTTLLLPRYSYTTATFELIGAETGLTLAPLELPPIQLNATYTLLVEAEFSRDGRSLLIQTEDRVGENTHYRLRLFNAITGKETAALQLPGIESLGNGASGSESGYHGFDRITNLWQNKTRLGKIIQFNQEHVTAVWTHTEDNLDHGKRGMMIVDFKTKTVQKIPFDELQLSEQQELQQGRSKDKHIYPEFDSFLNPDKGTLINISQYQESTHHDRRMGDRYLPLIGFSVRNIKDGCLLHTSQFTFPGLDRETILERSEVLTILPDNMVMIQQTNSLLASKSKLMEWIEKVKDWLRLPTKRHLHLINTVTGISEGHLLLNDLIKSAHLFSNGQTLALTGNDDGDFFLMKYDYPLHKPWLLILAWATGLAVFTLMLCEGVRILKRRRPDSQGLKAK